VPQPITIESLEAFSNIPLSFPRQQADVMVGELDIPRSDEMTEERLIPSALAGEEQYVDVGPNDGAQDFAMQLNAPVASDQPQPSEVPDARAVATNVLLDATNDEETTKMNKVEYFAKQIRHVRKLADEVLVKRTEWAQELDRLERSRDYLRNSTAELMSLLQRTFGSHDAHPKERQRTKKRMERTEEILRESPARPGDIDSPPTTITSTDSTGEKARTQSDSGVGSSSKPEFTPVLDATRVYEQYCRDYDAVLELETTMKRLTHELSNLDYRLKEKQKTMRDRLSSQTLAAELRSEMLDPGLDVSESSVPARTGSGTPPLVRQYFDRQGDVGIWRERLIELEYAHEEGKMEREFLRDRGDPVDPPDDEFNFNYKTRREHILDELAAAENDAGALRKECDNAGLNTEVHRESMHYTNSEPSPAASAQDIQDMPHSQSPVQALHMPAPLPAYGLLEPASLRVDEWLRDISTTPASELQEPLDP
jgi:hypothetical protein